MATFVLFLPASGGVNVSSARIPEDWAGSLAAVGLDHLDAAAFSQYIPRGPNGTPGKLFLFGPNAMTDRGYDPSTVWIPAIELAGQAAGRYSVGYLPDDPPTPEDLASGDAIGGYPVELGDGNCWDLPDLADIPPGSVEPQDGQNPVFVFFANALSQNYLITPEVVIALGLLNDDVVAAITGEADSPVILEAASVEAETDATPEVVPDGGMTDGADPWWYQFGLEVEAVASDVIRDELNADGGSQLSIVFASQMSLPMGCGVAALACSGFNLMPEIADVVKDRVTGPGPVTIINDAGFSEFDEGTGREFVKSAICGLLCHEVAHSLDSPRTFLTQMKPEFQAAVAAQIADDTGIVTTDDGTPDRSRHGANWLRACLLLVDRFERSGYSPSLTELGFENYGYASPAIYQATLSDEFDQYEGVPVREIIKTMPMSDDFVRQFASDIGLAMPPIPQQQPAAAIQAGSRTGRPLEIRAASVAIRDGQQPRMPIEEQAEILRLLRENRRQQRAV
jgi:hypothetical protein